MGNDEMIEGYMDGFSDTRDRLPSQSNRSHSYQHGWLNGRDDRMRKPRDVAENLREAADLATLKDAHPSA